MALFNIETSDYTPSPSIPQQSNFNIELENYTPSPSSFESRPSFETDFNIELADYTPPSSQPTGSIGGSPIPFAPKGPFSSGASTRIALIVGMSAAVGM